MFTPFHDKIEVRPYESDSPLSEQKVEAGEVLSKGKLVDFVEIGDTVYFDSWGCSKTSDGRYIVACNDQVILGKDDKRKE